jgi:hypothetical protein
MDAAQVAARIGKQAAVYNTHPFIRGIATILVATEWLRYQEIQAELHKSGGRLAPTLDYIQQGNVVTRWLPVECPHHLLFGQSAILVLREHRRLSIETLAELENTLIRARMAQMPDARIELI